MKNILSLNGTWRLAGFDEGHGDWALPNSLSRADVREIEAPVPGEVHTALLSAGLIQDPYYGMNANEAQWVEEKEWWYKQTFEVEEDFIGTRTVLEFDGLDTYATVFMNGRELGRTGNMFIAHSFDVSGTVQVGRNTVAVRFDPAAKILLRMEREGLFGCFNNERLNARKMQCAFGWDWSHRFVGAGIWRAARLVSYDKVSIADIHIEPEIEGGYANAWISIEVNNYSNEDQEVMASVVVALGENREKIEVVETISPFGGFIEAVIRIEEPQLWWPNGFGDPTLYSCLVGLQVEGEVVDVAEQKFGVREVRFVERDDEGNKVFTLLVNNTEIFCKGANWVPADSFPSNITDDKYRRLIKLAKDGNFNMLRVWGGGIYESPAFYDACDEMGIMVWQDFMFSCGTYPESEAFRRKIAQEASAVVVQLRNHPSIVVWCGNNECDMNLAPDAEWSGKVIFTEVIPNVLRALDDTRPYRVSSPYGGSIANDPAEGDWHGGAWSKAHDGDVSRWRHIIEEENALFVSEFYAEAPPSIESLKKFIPEDKLFPPDNEVWEFHNKDNPHAGRTDGKTNHRILIDLTRRMMGEFASAEEFAAYAGILQGEFMKAEVEHYRREKWKTSGALFWMYDDCWPAISWSLVDYYTRPKPAYYYAKRAFAPVIVSFKQLEDRVQLYVTSDRRAGDIDGILQVGVFSFGTCGFDVEDIPVKLTANTSKSFWESKVLDELLVDPTSQCIAAFLKVKDEIVAKDAYFSCTFGEMLFPQPRLLVQREQLDEHRHWMAISTESYARNVAIENLPDGAIPSDNYTDIFPGEYWEVVIDGITEKQAGELKVNVWRR